MTYPKVSIIVLNRDGKDFTLGCLKSVFKTDYPNFEVILVDNASTDNSPDVIDKKFSPNKKFRLLRSPINLGFAGGNNWGAQLARGEYLVFLNNDTEVKKNWLKELVEIAETYPKFGAASPKQLSLVKKDRIDALGGTLDRFLWSKKEGYQEKDRGQYDTVQEVFYAQGSAFLIKKSLFDKVGGFDQSYVIYYEEVDLCWRLWLAGYKVLFIPQSVIYHFGGGWQKKQPEARFFYLLRRNHLTNLIKNYGARNLVKRLPVVLLFNLITIIFCLFRGDPKRSVAYLAAIGYNILHLPSILRKRKFVQRRLRRLPDEKLERLFYPKVLFFSHSSWPKPGLKK